MTGSVARTEARTPRRWFERGPLTSLRHEMDELFENFFGAPTSTSHANVAMPSIDVAETDNAIEVKTDLPGFQADDVDIEIRDGILTISGQSSEVRETNEGSDRKYHRIERQTGSFSRSVRLPCGVDQDNVDAELKDGVLTVSLPKADDTKSRKVTINGA